MYDCAGSAVASSSVLVYFDGWHERRLGVGSRKGAWLEHRLSDASEGGAATSSPHSTMQKTEALTGVTSTAWLEQANSMELSRLPLNTRPVSTLRYYELELSPEYFQLTRSFQAECCNTACYVFRFPACCLNVEAESQILSQHCKVMLRLVVYHGNEQPTSHHFSKYQRNIQT